MPFSSPEKTTFSFLLAVSGAKCYTKVVNRAIWKACKNSGFVEITQVLREEIRYLCARIACFRAQVF
jgi:hypothetical protein